MLELKGVSKIYKTKSQDVHALDNINLVFEEKGLVFITGKSGSGKTTLLNVIGGLDNFEEGEIIIKDKNTKDFTKADFDSYRNTYIGFVFQEYNLIDTMNIRKNLALALEFQGKKGSEDELNEILNKVDLTDVLDRKPQELSGGQRQRVAIARALIKNPSIIMADEPTGALDSENGLQVISLLKKLSEEKLVIVVSHDLDLADKFADRIINLIDGHIESDITITKDKEKKINVVSDEKIVSVRRGASLKDAELKQIKTAVQEGKDIVVTDNINIKKEKTKNVSSASFEQANFIKTHMGFWPTIKLGISSLKTKKVRLIITIILCAIAFAIFGIFDSLAIYDEGRLAANTLKASTTRSIIMTARVAEDNGNSYKIDIGDSLLNSLERQTGYDIKGVYTDHYIGNGATPPKELNGSENKESRLTKYYYDRQFLGAVEFDEQDLKNYKFSLTRGRLPENYDEVAVSEYFAYCMVNWGYRYEDENGEIVVVEDINDIINEDASNKPLPLTITAYDKEYKIVGIVNTGKIPKKFDKLKENFDKGSSLLKQEYLDYIKSGYYLYLFTKPGFSENAINEYKFPPEFVNSAFNYQFDGAQFRENDIVNFTATAFYNYNDLKNLSEDFNEKNIYFIDQNQTKLDTNEILIDVRLFKTIYGDMIDPLISMAQASENSFEGVADATQFLANYDIYNSLEKLNALKTIIPLMSQVKSKIPKEDGDMKKVFNVTKLDNSKRPLKEVGVENKEYKIAGFYAGTNITGDYPLVLESSGLSNLGINLMQGRYSSFIATNTGKGKVNKLSALLLRTRGNTYYCNNSALATVRANTEFFSNLSLLFLIVSVVFAIFSVVMFANFISTSIKNKYGEIGILRALGARGADIFKMFVVEAIALALINALFASIVAGIGCIFVNMFLANYLNFAIPLAAFGLRQIGLIIALSIVVGTLSAIIPIWSISKQKPVETIRKAL